jgi:hypothetical protein
MRRREFITLLGVVSVLVPRAGGLGVSMVARHQPERRVLPGLSLTVARPLTALPWPA